MTLMDDKKARARELFSKTSELYKKSYFGDVLYYCHEALKNDPTFREPYLLIGKVYVKAHEIDLALENFNTFLRLSHNADHKIDKSRAYNGIASTFDFKGEHHKSIVYYKMALEIAKEENNLKYQAIYNNNIGLCLRRLNDAKSALPYYHKALEICQKMQDIEKVRFYYFNISQLYTSIGRFFMAFRYMRKFKKIDKQIQKQELNTKLKNLMTE